MDVPVINIGGDMSPCPIGIDAPACVCVFEWQWSEPG